MSTLAPVAYRVEITRLPPSANASRRPGAVVALVDDGGPLCAERIEARQEADLWHTALSTARFKAGLHGGIVGQVVDKGLLICQLGREEWRHERLGSRCSGAPCACGKPATGVLVHDDDAARGRTVTTGPVCCEPCAFDRAKADLRAIHMNARKLEQTSSRSKGASL